MRKINFKKSKNVIIKKLFTVNKKDQHNNYKYPMETRHHFLSKLQMKNKIVNRMAKKTKKKRQQTEKSLIIDRSKTSLQILLKSIAA